MSTAATHLRAATRPALRLVLRRWQVVALAAIAPVALGGLYVTTNVRATLAQRDLRAQWDAIAAQPRIDAAELSTRAIRAGEPVGRLVVAAAGIDLIVTEGPSSTHRAPVHRAASVRPGLPGITVIDAGRFAYANMFLNLPRLVPGDTIVIQTRAGPVRYRVTNISTVAASAVDARRDATVPTLLLVSRARAWGSTDRIVVRAEAAGGVS